MTTNEMILEAQELLGLIHMDTQSVKEQELLRAAFDALEFVERAGHIREFEDYRKRMAMDHAPFVVAVFATRAEADRWLKNIRYPPHSAYVLIGDDYHLVMDFLDSNHRMLSPYPLSIQLYLEVLLEDGPPHVVASFKMREQARVWFESLNEKPAQVIVDIGDEWYLVAYHHNIDHLAFHPFSLLKKLMKSASSLAE